MSRIARYLLAFATTVAVTAGLYYFGPNRPPALAIRVARRDAGDRAMAAGHFGFGWYVRNIGHYNVLYGSVGAALALLVWMYLLAAIALIGCEFNAVYERSQR